MKLIVDGTQKNVKDWGSVIDLLSDDGTYGVRFVCQANGKWDFQEMNYRQGYSGSGTRKLITGQITEKKWKAKPKTAAASLSQLKATLRDLVSHVDAGLAYVTKGGGSKSALVCNCGLHSMNSAKTMTCASFQAALNSARLELKL